MSALWAVLAVYLCGYGITATMVAAELHERMDADPDPELQALRHEYPGAVAAGVAFVCTLASLIWPLFACRPTWWRMLLGLPTHR